MKFVSALLVAIILVVPAFSSGNEQCTGAFLDCDEEDVCCNSFSCLPVPNDATRLTCRPKPRESIQSQVLKNIRSSLSILAETCTGAFLDCDEEDVCCNSFKCLQHPTDATRSTCRPKPRESKPKSSSIQSQVRKILTNALSIVEDN